MKTVFETLRLAVIFAILSFALLTVIAISTPTPPASSGIEY